MRTLAAKMKDASQHRYESDQSRELDPAKPADAKKMLAAAGGAKAAKLAIKDLWAQAQKYGEGWLLTARINAPLRVIEALVTLGVFEQADDNDERETVAFRYRLTEIGLRHAITAGARRE